LVTSHDLIDARVRELSANDLDAVRPLARQFGFRHTNSDVLRFCVGLAAEVGRRLGLDGIVDGFPLDFRWPLPKRPRYQRRHSRQPVEADDARATTGYGRIQFP
jgi:hypothetical protein